MVGGLTPQQVQEIVEKALEKNGKEDLLTTLEKQSIQSKADIEKLIIQHRTTLRS